MPLAPVPSDANAVEPFVLVSTLPVRTIFLVHRQVFQVEANLFLKFAKEDLSADTLRGRVNGLTNAKRAIANRIDALLSWSLLLRTAQKEKWGFPRRVTTLQAIGFSTPGVLNRMANKSRNLLEHEYLEPPPQDDVQDVIDIAELYLGNTERYLEAGFPRAAVYSSNIPQAPITSLKGLPEKYDALEFDPDRACVSSRSSLGSFAGLSFSRIGEARLVQAAQRLLAAILSKDAFRVSLASEEDFIAIS